jgi:hypothetical protein
MFGNKDVKRRKYAFKEAMSMVGFAEASTNRVTSKKSGKYCRNEGCQRNDDINHYYLEGFRPDADVSGFSIVKGDRAWVKKDPPF